jgi:endonuclease/exonuclease/phosphatase family metal-dependent hydrolase
MNSKTLKIGTYNIKHASDLGRYAQVMGELIAKNDLDIVGLQEIDLFCNRSGNKDILKEIAQAAGYPYYQFYKTISYQNGEYGLGIISKYPIENSKVISLSHCNEPRILVNALLNLGNFKLNFLVTHLDLGTYQDVRKYQFLEVAGTVKDLKSFILVGDFNVHDWNDVNNPLFEYEEYLSQYNLLNNQKNCFLTFSGRENIGGGILPLDNIITSNDFKQVKAYMVDTDYSDHDLLIGEFQLIN